MTSRLLGLGLIVLATAHAALAVEIAGWAEPEAGVAAGNPGSIVSWVFPGGPSWADGIRAGQTVVELTSGLNPSSWRLVATDGHNLNTTSYLSQIDRLRQAFPIALLAAALVALALLLLVRPAVSAALAGVSILFSASAIAPSGQQLIGTAALLLALFVPVAWLVVCGSPRTVVRIGLVALAAAVAVEWLITVYALPSMFEVTDSVRQAASIGAGLTTLLFCGDLRKWHGRLLDLDSRRAVNVAAVVAVLAIAVFVSLRLAPEAAIIVVLVAGGSLLYPGFRRGLADLVDQVLLGDIRERASIKAVEEERSRIARDLHDAPLQDIAAVIRELDRKPGTERETDLLRRVADRLRRVTTELRPPILDDLGLRAAIAYLGDQATESAPGLEVVVSLVPDDPLAERPPAEVELAVFRIMREAVDNALHHAEAEHLLIEATVLAQRVDALVEDNGTGIVTKARRDAARAGHLGLLSMAQRAALIGADFEIQRVSPHGTRVRVAWRGGQ
jgi:signal transduction histidine kinase